MEHPLAAKMDGPRLGVGAERDLKPFLGARVRVFAARELSDLTLARRAGLGMRAIATLTAPQPLNLTSSWFSLLLGFVGFAGAV